MTGMIQLFRRVSLALLVGLGCAAALVGPAPAADCRAAAIEQLRTLAPDGYAVYRRITDKQFFLNWITCDDLQLGLSTAVHESVHFITSHDDAFPLIDGSGVQRPHAVSRFYAPSHIAKRFGRSDFVTTYLRPGKASSATDFLYLLDELNAYSHDLRASMDLNALALPDQEVEYRDGLAAAMAFVARYVETAEASEPETWAGLQEPGTAEAVAALWRQAETVMAASCAVPNFGAEDKGFLRQVCQPKTQAALETILGRPPSCPTACLRSASTVGE